MHVGAGSLQEEQMLLSTEPYLRIPTIHIKEECRVCEKCPLEYQMSQCMVAQTKMYLDYLTVLDHLHV